VRNGTLLEGAALRPKEDAEDVLQAGEQVGASPDQAGQGDEGQRPPDAHHVLLQVAQVNGGATLLGSALLIVATTS
jgi:hypothetical protein